MPIDATQVAWRIVNGACGGLSIGLLLGVVGWFVGCGYGKRTHLHTHDKIRSYYRPLTLKKHPTTPLPPSNTPTGHCVMNPCTGNQDCHFHEVSLNEEQATGAKGKCLSVSLFVCVCVSGGGWCLSVCLCVCFCKCVPQRGAGHRGQG